MDVRIVNGKFSIADNSTKGFFGTSGKASESSAGTDIARLDAAVALVYLELIFSTITIIFVYVAPP